MLQMSESEFWSLFLLSPGTFDLASFWILLLVFVVTLEPLSRCRSCPFFILVTKKNNTVFFDRCFVFVFSNIMAKSKKKEARSVTPRGTKSYQ